MGRDGETAKGRKGEWANGRAGSARSGAQLWWGEAPERLSVFSRSLVTFGNIIRKADSLPSRWPSAMQLKSVGIGLCL
jgi:hypothetical protein